MQLLDLIFLILRGLEILIFVDALLSFLMPPDKFPRSLTTQITDPLYAPVRAIIKPEALGGFDISPLILIIILRVMTSMLAGAT
jgi:uncharacterized protein YggT (Ycf19 family)